MVESLTSVQRQMLIADNIKLVYHVANKFMPCPKGYCYEVDDLISEGYIGLVVAAKNYDPAKGSFSSYACKVIESRIKRSLPKYRLTLVSLDSPLTKDEEEETTVGDVIDSGFSVENEVIRRDIVTRLQKYLAELTDDEREQVLRYIHTGKVEDDKLFKSARKKLLRAMKQDQFEADLDDLTVFISCPAVHVVAGNGYFSSPVETTVLTREEKRKQLEVLSSIPQLDKLRVLKQQGEQDRMKLLAAKWEVEEFIERHIDKLSINHIKLLQDYFVWCYSHLAMVQKYGSGYKVQIKRAVKKLMG
ncbi:RNA polymerase sigma factor, sigma-70 family [Caldicellulosiruptor kronotskyensis 2002]|uniref:RNA polymerase sigma factor, sigma-70 family n=1 Tax=Caldicellulosiruptor kronotskyensis (strain DSM 18902 / VKM B-2412 / 2002) TaxID=632348 RepID=E4SB04_CALK2|nr:sigma-70 family RNA polymerase sigma factor [Caldicellulosiruptor kronotskyensis]ADQ45659.1 RNA polymerase sigma factor, sigma-70 family [Caldicellulosiruptor kronotskyensis 2002]